MRLVTASVFAALLAPAAAQGATPTKQQMTCPIGGAKFDHPTYAAYSTFGERPDGKPYGSAAFPVALPECPDNRLILYKDYEPEEVAKLEPLIASEGYKALLAGDTQYYRAYWLMKEMGVAPERYLIALLQAGWEADGKPELRTRYLTELVEASAALPARPDDINWIAMEARAANALRELGRFDEASARLDKLPTLGLDIDLGEAPAAGPGKKADPKRQWLAYTRKLRAAIARKDASAEPFDMIPRGLALGRCLAAKDKIEGAQKGFCETERAAVEELRLKRASGEAAKIIARPREESGR